MGYEFDYVKTGDGVRVTAYHGSALRVEIPAEIGGLPVRAVGTHTFYEDGLFIESIRVPGTVHVIEAGAFELCLSLTELILEEGVETIGAGAFLATGLEWVMIPASVRQIDAIGEITCTLQFAEGNQVYATDGFGIYQNRVLAAANGSEAPDFYEIREGTTAAAPDVFADCALLEGVKLPASLTELPEGVLVNIHDPFAQERGIHKICAAEKNPVFFTEHDALYRKTGPGLSLVRYFGKASEPEISEQTYRICREAFFRTGIRRVQIPASVKEIGPDAFLENPLEEAVFPDGTVYFPQSDSYLLKNLLKEFGQNGRLYDFSTYDEILQEKHLNLNRVRMTCSRLEYAVDLPEGRHALLWASLLGRMEEIIQMIAEQNDLTLLKRLAGHGFVTEQNIDRLIRVANGDGKERGPVRRLNGIMQPAGGTDGTGTEVHRETLAWLMDYKNRELQTEAFDFSL